MKLQLSYVTHVLPGACVDRTSANSDLLFKLSHVFAVICTSSSIAVGLSAMLCMVLMTATAETKLRKQHMCVKTVS